MKTAVIGTGLTGGKVAELLGGQAVTYNEENPPTPEKLREADVSTAIVFVPGDAGGEVLPVLLEAGIPAVWGTTGYSWPAGLSERVKATGATWVIGSNFSLGMNLVRKTIELLGRGSSMLENPEYRIHEVHHTRKKDAPSGTALSWKEWLGREADITSKREGDVKGIHELEIKTANESIFLKHEAHDRAVFAEGAIWTARYLFDHPELEKGVHSFAEIFDRAYRQLT